ncbi:MAG TPA: glycoside hydrolase family 38 C-terminal domain-containing protein [Kineosporiaceae bacterium]|nr:glycoside hydrolase family 38 C-terminal domain-containing protein [Kineosporiaceae bacterium]
MRIVTIESTDLFVRTPHGPRPVVRVHLALDGSPQTGAARPRVQARVRVEGPSVSTPEPVLVSVHDLAPDLTEIVVEVPVSIAAPAPEGSVHRVTAIVDGMSGDADMTASRSTAEGVIQAAATGWTMWMVSHFHYDPVWWNTQAGFSQTWYDQPVAEARRPAISRTAFDLTRAHLEAARDDPDYRFVLAELDYLKPHWDAAPADREQMRRLISQGRLELVGGSYNEPNTNLTHPESTIRNAVYGVGYQRDVLGGDPRTAWQLDVFGHDPSYPGLMAQAGLDSSAWARGPFHMVGPKRHAGDITRMQFPSEFEWISPSGIGLLTHYMADHYVAGWQFEVQPNLEAAMADAYREFKDLKQVAATRNVLLPVGHDHNIPSRWCTQIHREWAKRYEWPRFVVGLPRDFFAAVRAETAASGIALSPQTRDMNPVFTGKDVSYIDTKQAQRAAEVSVLDAERLATLAWLLGAHYPAEALDKAWRLLLFGAHHDAITGTESDQVYLDLLGGWREAFELGDAVRTGSLDHLATRADTAGPGAAVLVANTLSWARDGVVTVRLRLPESSAAGIELRDEFDRPVPAVTESAVHREDGSLAEVTLTFLARDVPALGYRTYQAVSADCCPAGWQRRDSPSVENSAGIENAAFRVEPDPARGGALNRILDRRSGRELLRPGGLGAELYLQAELPEHPVWGEGPWHLLPTGPGRGMRETPVEVRIETSPVGTRLVSSGTVNELEVTQEVTLWDDVPRVDLRVHVDGSIGHDHLLRLRFEFDLPGTLPVAEVGFAAVGRSFGFPNADTAEHQWTLDSPAHTWAGLSATARIALHRPGNPEQAQMHAIGVAEVVAGPGLDPGTLRGLLAALVRVGVTATTTDPDGQRYGALDADSNLPDVRIVIGAENSFTHEALGACAAGYAATLTDSGRVFIPAAEPRTRSLVPGADLRGVRDLPVLIVTGSDLDAEVAALVADLDDAIIDVDLPVELAGTAEPAVNHSVAVINQGTPGFVAETDGTAYVSLMRACSGWPSGLWIDGAPRTTPDGASFSWQHWSHTFELSLVSGAGDWREAGFVRSGQEVNHPLLARQVPSNAGELPASLSLLSVEPEQAVLSALKPSGNPLASALSGSPRLDDGLAVRLYESIGRPVTAAIRMPGGVADAAPADLLERPLPEGPESLDGVAVQVRDGVAHLQLAPAEVLTLNLRPDLASSSSVFGPSGTGPHLGPTQELVQPVHTRYWLHNKGPAPLGYLPVSVNLSPSTVRVPRGGSVPLSVTVACSGRPATGAVQLELPPGLILDVETGSSLDYALAAGEHTEFTVLVRDDGGLPGTYWVAARIADDLGQTLEDTVEVQLTGDESDLALTSFEESAALLDVRLEPSTVDLTPGETATLIVQLSSRARSAVHGEVQLLSPYGSWGASPGDLDLQPWTQAFAVEPGADGKVRFAVHAPAGVRPGTQVWALAKVMYHGRVHYTPAVDLRVSP